MMSAQEQTFYTQYHINPILINPAFAGFNDAHNVSFNFRNRWTGFDGSPKAYTLSYDGPIADRLGIGVQLWQENIGDFKNQKFGAKASYRIIDAITKIQGGLSIDYHSLKIR